jgi:hypothetical protein
VESFERTICLLNQSLQIRYLIRPYSSIGAVYALVARPLNPTTTASLAARATTPLASSTKMPRYSGGTMDAVNLSVGSSEAFVDVEQVQKNLCA